MILWSNEGSGSNCADNISKMAVVDPQRLTFAWDKMAVNRCLYIISNASYRTDLRHCIESVDALVHLKLGEVFVIA